MSPGNGWRPTNEPGGRYGRDDEREGQRLLAVVLAVRAGLAQASGGAPILPASGRRRHGPRSPVPPSGPRRSCAPGPRRPGFAG